MAKVPASFFLFQALVTEAITEVGDAAPGSGEMSTREKSLSFLCDNVLSSLHAEEDFRDAVVDSRANPTENAVLLVINNEFEKLDDLITFISGVEHVSAVGRGEKIDPRTKEKVMVIKIKGHGQDCNPNDPKDKAEDGKNATTSVSQPVST
jgi:hypothetical protein